MENTYIKQINKCPTAVDSLNVSVICCSLDKDLTIRWHNSCFFESTGYSREDFVALFSSLRQFYAEYPADFETITEQISHAASHAAEAFAAVRLPKKGGDFFWTRLSYTITNNTAEGESLLQVVFTNIDALIQENEHLSALHTQKLQYFYWMMDLYTGNIYISDMETYELLYLNETSCHTLGCKKNELLGKKCYEVIQGRSSPCPFCTNKYLTADAFYEWEYDNPVLRRTFMIKNRMINWKGRAARIELSHDMYSTEYKLAKKDREREALLASISGGFARLDARDYSTILWYGSEFLNLIGYTAEQFEKELHSQCSYVHPDDLMRILPMMQAVDETGTNLITEARIITRSGKIKIFTLTLYYINAEDSWDGIPSFYSIGIDVTKDREEQMRQRQALEDAYQAARIANNAKSNFLSAMSHDIRTPMNAIMGMSSIAQANLHSPEKVGSCLDKINVASQHLLTLLNEVLDMSKIESGKIDLSAEVISLPELVQNLIDMCQPLIAEKKQELKVIAIQVQHETVIADGGRLQQAFMNLLTNAMKYTPEGGSITIKIRELPSVIKGKGQYEFDFQDNGIGMSEDFITHIFEPFTRAEDTRISKIPGTGLGMAITENIISMMNGTIQVKSQLGRGSEFTVAVPLELPLEEDAYDETLAGLRVLIVDDDQTVCESVASLLSELGLCTDWVLSGAEAVDHIIATHGAGSDYYAIMLDWRMPDMSGLETLKEIRRRLDSHIPVIVISSYNYSYIEEEFVEAGADGFITKPLFKSKLHHVLQAFCKQMPGQPPIGREAEVTPILAGKRILLVEDNDLNREIAVELLQMHGVLVDEVRNGQEAVNRFLDTPSGTYDCILMDIQMPIMNGYEATQAIRALNRNDAKRIPILALSANTFTSDLGKAFNVGMNDHIAKPIDIQLLIEVLQKWM